MGRPAKSDEEKLVEVPCKVSQDAAQQIAEIAISTDRYRGQIVRKLVYRGLHAYRRDSNLDDSDDDGTTPGASPLLDKLVKRFSSLPADEQETAALMIDAMYQKHRRKLLAEAHGATPPIPTEKIDRTLSPGQTLTLKNKKGGQK